MLIVMATLLEGKQYSYVLAHSFLLKNFVHFPFVVLDLYTTKVKLYTMN